MQRSFRIGGLDMEIPLIVGAGVCKTVPSLAPLLRPDVSVGAIVLGAVTPKGRKGNDGVLFWPDDLAEFTSAGFGLNSFGMPNDGYEAVATMLQSSYPHPIVVSVAGDTVEEIIEGVRCFDNHPGVAAIEVNLGCPNKKEDRVAPQCYNRDFVSQLLRRLQSVFLRKPVWLKLSAFLIQERLKVIAGRYQHLDFRHTPAVPPGYVRNLLETILFLAGKAVKAVVLGNTLGNVIYRNEDGVPVTTPNGGQAGLSGPILKEIYLHLYREHRDLFYDMGRRGISAIGMGGVCTGDDGADYLDDGFDAFGVTSLLFWSGNNPRVLADLIAGSERLQQHLTSETDQFAV